MKINWLSLSLGCTKGLLVSLNSLCIAVALCTLTLSAVDIRILRQYGEERASGTLCGDVFIIAACVLVLMVACLGIVGTARESIKLLYLYIGLLTIMTVLELMIAIYVSMQRHHLEFRITEWLRDDFFANYTEDALANHNEVWDRLQDHYECCGLNGPEDYPAVLKKISMSCCSRAYKARTTYAQQQLYTVCLNSRSYYEEGCEDVILRALGESANCFLGISVICLWLQGLGMLMAMWVANILKRNIIQYIHEPDLKYKY